MCVGGGGGRRRGGGEKNGSASQRARDGDGEKEIVTFIYLSSLLFIVGLFIVKRFV